MTEVTLGLIAVFTSIISAVAGMAGGTVLLAAMTFVLTWEAIVPVHGLVQLASNGSRSFFLAKKINKKIFMYYALGAPIGAFIAYFLIKQLTNEALPQLLIVALIAYVLFKPKKMPDLKIPVPGFFILGMTAGFLGLLIGAVGPLLGPFFLRKDLEKEQIVATMATCQVVTHAIKVPVFLMLGFDYSGYILLIVTMTLAAVLGSKLGLLLLGKMNEKVFRWIYQIALAGAAIRIVYKLI